MGKLLGCAENHAQIQSSPETAIFQELIPVIIGI